LSRITWTPELHDVAKAGLVIEAVPEVLELKLSLMQELDEIVSPDVVIGSNTSPIPIAELAGKVQHAGRVVGIHFFSPVHGELGKHPIKTKDRSWFIVNFLLIGQLMAAIRMFEEGFATREDIDDGMRLGAGHPIGPLALADMVGLDVCHAVPNSLLEEFKRDEYAPPPLLKRMIAAGRLGRKSGRGFYEYT
jgi:3-hydroxybutyryl-CoA dehydrogenase